MLLFTPATLASEVDSEMCSALWRKRRGKRGLTERLTYHGGAERVVVVVLKFK
jgi:hypothetical protein